jgi:hypothetical protein
MKKIIRALKQEDHSRGCAVVASYYSNESGRKGLQRERAANPMYTETFDNKRIVCKYYKRNDLKESGWHGELIDYVSDATFEEVGATLKEARYKMNRVIRNSYASEPVKPEVLVDKLELIEADMAHAEQLNPEQAENLTRKILQAPTILPETDMLASSLRFYQPPPKCREGRLIEPTILPETDKGAGMRYKYQDMVNAASWLFGADSPAYRIAELSASVAYTPCILLESPRAYKDYLLAKMVFKGAGYPEYAGAVDNLYRGMRNEPDNGSIGLDSGVPTTL